MMDFIRKATMETGIDEGAARDLTGGLLGMIRQHVPEGTFGELTAKIPGAAQMARQPAMAGATGGLGRLASGVMHMLAGEKGGNALEIAALFKQSGVGHGQGTTFVTMFMHFIREKAGADLAGRIAGQVPALRAFLG